MRLVNNCGRAFVRYSEEMIPLHPCLQLISNCEQTLSSHTSRRLITMEKIKEPEVCAFTFSFYSVNDGTLKLEPKFKPKFIVVLKLSARSRFFHPHFLACVVLWFYCQQSPPQCSFPTCAHCRMFTGFYEHEQET